MSSILILVVGAIYLYTSISLIYNNQHALGFTFLCYALSNLGLYFVARAGI